MADALNTPARQPSEIQPGQDRVTFAEGSENDLMQKREEIGLTLAQVRNRFMIGRRSSGIEDIWREDEEYYNGIDGTNNRAMTPWGSKPLGQAGLSISGEQEDGTTGSTVFINISQAYADAVSARVSDMLMPVDGPSWDFNETPYPELIPFAKGLLPAAIQSDLQQAYQGDPNGMQAKAAEIQQNADAAIKDAKDKMGKAKRRMMDWQTESQYHSERRKSIEMRAKLGTGILKGPYPKKITHFAYTQESGLIRKDDIIPASKSINPWNFYPDPDCGETLQNGSGVFERDEISAKALRQLRGLEGYFDDQIDMCIAEGPHKAVVTESAERDVGAYGLKKGTDKAGVFEIWYWHGELKRDEIIGIGSNILEGMSSSDSKTHFSIKATMVNNRVVQMVLNPLDTGDYPYDAVPWKRVSGWIWGVGIVRQIRAAQQMLNGAVRSMMDNAGRAGGPQVLFKRGLVEPENGIYEIVPWKFWEATDDADLEHLENAMRFIKIDMFQNEFQAIIMLALRFAEDISGMPMIMQGQVSQSTPDTLGGMKLQNDNASTVLRRIARLDDDFMEPHYNRYYAYLLQYGPDDSEKGDFAIQAKGSTSGVERELQAAELQNMKALADDPKYGIDPIKWRDQYFASRRMDPKLLAYDDDKWKEIVANMAAAGQKGDTSVEVAKIRAESAAQLQQLKEDGENQRHSNDLEVKLLIQSMEQDLNSVLTGMQEKGLNERQVNDLKAAIAQAVMKLQTQKELSMHKAVGQQALPAPTEPAGKAPKGESFEK